MKDDTNGGIISGLLASYLSSKMSTTYERLSGFNRKKHIDSCTKNRKKRKSKHK